MILVTRCRKAERNRHWRTGVQSVLDRASDRFLAAVQPWLARHDLHIRILLSVCLSHVGDANRQHEGMDKVLAFLTEREEEARNAAQ